MRQALLLVCGVLFVAAQAEAGDVLLMPDSTNNRLVTFNPFDGSVVNSNVFGLAGGTPISAIQVGSEIWVSEQAGDRVSRWSQTGTPLGAITGALDNLRGATLVGSTVYVAAVGTQNGAPGPSVHMFNTLGGSLGFFLTPVSDGFHVLAHQGGLLVSSETPNDDIHRYTLAGAPAGTFHNSTSLDFAEQMGHATNGDIWVAGFITSSVVRLDPNTGALLDSFAATNPRGVHQLGNGNVLWTNSSGAHVYNVGSGTSSQVYAGGGRFLSFQPVPEPGSLLALGAGLGLFARRRKRAK